MLIAGVDEAGRGPLAGPVIAAAVILDPDKRIIGLNDSKLLTQIQRESLFEKICQSALAWSVARAEVQEIDQINILQASLLAMQRAIIALTIKPVRALIDGNHAPKLDIPTECIIDGDRLKPAISAASIIAKVTRDREMIELDRQFPGFGFAQHKGYGTEIHLKALRKLGPCEIHRRSFSPVRLVQETGLQYNVQQGLLYHSEMLANSNSKVSRKSKISSKTSQIEESEAFTQSMTSCEG
jgi:ribonuclease HII